MSVDLKHDLGMPDINGNGDANRALKSIPAPLKSIWGYNFDKSILIQSNNA